MGVPQIYSGLTEQERRFVYSYALKGDVESSKLDAGYLDSTSGHYLLRKPHIAAAVRAEVMRLLVTEGAQLAYKSLKRIAQDEKLPAAAQVAAAKALLQGAGLLDQAPQGKEAKSINDMDRAELHQFINSKRQEIEAMESALADRAKDITPGTTPQHTEMLD